MGFPTGKVKEHLLGLYKSTHFSKVIYFIFCVHLKTLHKMKRNVSSMSSGRSRDSKDDVFLPFFPSQWRYLKSLVMDDSINIETSKKIIDLLTAIQQRDTADGRLGLALTYEIYNAFYHLHKLDRNNNIEGATLQSVLACALQRSVNHLHEVCGHLKGGPSPTYRATMEYFSLPGVIAKYRNDIAHGNYPSVDDMVEAMAKIRQVVIDKYWKPFDGNTPANPRPEGGKEDLFADFSRKCRIFFEAASPHPQTEEEEKSLRDMALRPINNDFHYFAKSLFSTLFAIKDEDGYCFKSLPSPVRYSEIEVWERLPRFMGVIYPVLKETGNMFYFCIHGFQSIENAESKIVKERLAKFFFACAEEIVKKGYCFSINETIHLLKWEEAIKPPENIFYKTVPEDENDITRQRITTELNKLVNALRIAEREKDIDYSGVSAAKVDQNIPWGKFVFDKYKDF
uniref:HEPN_Apea domain-containing protein n=1 Tax=Strongyloides papillosus TaxID=174720 RepID=A0A0N5BQA7_STREA